MVRFFGLTINIDRPHIRQSSLSNRFQGSKLTFQFGCSFGFDLVASNWVVLSDIAERDITKFGFDQDEMNARKAFVGNYKKKIKEISTDLAVPFDRVCPQSSCIC